MHYDATIRPAYRPTGVCTGSWSVWACRQHYMVLLTCVSVRTTVSRIAVMARCRVATPIVNSVKNTHYQSKHRPSNAELRLHSVVFEGSTNLRAAVSCCLDLGPVTLKLDLNIDVLKT